MFKYGQIIKSDATGELYFVKSWPDNLVGVEDSRTYEARHSCFKVIVNNFKYKDSWISRFKD